MQTKSVFWKVPAVLLSLLCIFLFACAPAEPQTPATNDTTAVSDTTAAEGSSSQNDTTEPNGTADAASLASAILEKGDFSEELSAMKESKIAAVYSIDGTALVSGAVYFAGSGAYPDEIAVLTADSEEHAAEMKAAMENYLAAQRETWADYRPAEVPKLEASVLMQNGCTVVFCVCANADTVSAFLQSYFAS